MSRRSMLHGFFTGARLKVLILGAGTLLALSFALIWSSQSSSAAEQGPVAAYSFDSESEPAVDISGHKNEGTVEGASWTPHGRYGGALEFDGEESCVTIPDGPQFQMGEEFTLEAWVRPDSNREFSPIFYKQDGETGYGYALWAQEVEEGGPAGEVDDATYPEPQIEGKAELPVHTWSHLAFTYDGAHMRLYVNGELVDAGASEAPIESEGPLKIGCADDYGYEHHFEGRIDEPRVYERALSAGEVAADMETPIDTPKSGPVAAYSFDSESEPAVDISGHKNEGTVEGASWTPHGRYGGALEFDGEEGCVTIPDGPQFQMGEEFTLEAWVRPEGPHEFSPVFYKQDGEGGYGYALWAETVGGEPEGEVNDGTYPVPRVEGKTGLPADTWSHLAFTYDGAQIRLYVDGELVDSGAAEAPIESEGPLKIGCAADFGYDHYFEGRIDEPTVYERALSAGEVAADMETPIQTPKAGPLAAYSFDEGEPGDETVEDVSGNGHTATIEGEAEWAKGRYGGALSFLKEGDCASVADSPELRLTEEFTLEAWVRPDGGIYEDPVVVRESGGEDIFGLGIGSTEEGYAEAFIGEGGEAQTAVGGPEIREYEWVHLAATWDGQKIRLYVDGELADTQAASAPGGAVGGLRIGCDSPNGPFGGRIDELRVYDRALNPAEVGYDMEQPLETPKATPVAEYSFDEDNEETATDLTGDGHTATVEGAKWTEHGRYGGAYEFDGEEEDVLKIPASPELDFDEEFTLEAWVRPSGADNHHAPLIDKQEGGGLGYFLYEGGIVSDRPVGAVEEGQEHVHADDPLPTHAWSHVALTFTGNRTYLYVDGELVDNGAAEPVVTSEGELEIGGSTDTSEYFDGRIDDVRIYNRGLAAAEVAADMEAPIQTPKSEPIASWGFNEGEGSTAQDASSNEHLATIEGAKWANGKYGDALEFDGEDDVVTVPNSPEFGLTEGFTLEAWVRPESDSAEWAPILAKEMGGGETAEELAWWLYEGGHEPNVPYGGTETASSKRNEALAEDPLPVDVWSYVTLAYDGAQVVLYVDGELIDCSEAPSDGPRVSEGQLEIGGASEAGDFYRGRIDEVRIYDRAISREEIVSDMDTPVVMELSESYAVEVEEEGEEEAGTVIATAALQALGPGEPSGRARLLLMFQKTGVGHVMTPEQKKEYGITGKGEVRIQGYRFNDCPDPEKDINGIPLPSKESMPGKEILLKLAKNGESRQCHNVYNEETEKLYLVTWAVSASGIFFRRPGKEVWVKEPPVCKQSGPFSPNKYTDCEIPKWRSTDHLDVIGDWRFEDGTYDASIGGGQSDKADICARMDGVLPINVKPSLNFEEVFQGNHHGQHSGSHWHYWLANRFDAYKPCYFDDPREPVLGS